MHKILSSLQHALLDINHASRRIVEIQTELQDPRRGPRPAARQF